MRPLRFLADFAVATLIIAAILGGFNVLMDPYLVFGTPRISAFNAVKPSVDTQEWLMKAYQSSRMHPRTVILGSSRTDVGLDPASATWSTEQQPVYNLSLAGAGAADNVRYLKHLVASNGGTTPNVLVVGLDFENFLYRPVSAKLPRSETSSEHLVPEISDKERRLAVQSDGALNPYRTMQTLKDRALAAWSLDALLDSLRTVFVNVLSSGSTANIEDNGHLAETQFQQWVAHDGVAMLFEQKNVITVRDLAEPHQILRDTPNAPIKEMAPVQQLINFAKSNRSKLFLTIQPAHAMRLELLAHLGYWRDFEIWKQELTQVVADAAANGVDVSLWDFSGYDEYSVEPVPAAGDHKSRMQWFWDPVHYTVALGNLMLTRLFDSPDTSGYGVRLHPETIMMHLAQVRERQQNYRRHASDAKRVLGLLCRSQGCG